MKESKTAFVDSQAEPCNADKVADDSFEVQADFNEFMECVARWGQLRELERIQKEYNDLAQTLSGTLDTTGEEEEEY